MKVLAIIIGLTAAVFLPMDEHRLVSWVIVPSSSLSIDGSSNVNTFSCSMSNYQRADTLVVLEHTPSYIKFSPNQLAIPVRDFNCGSNLITRDFREMLQTGEHPEIGVSFLSFKKVGHAQSSRIVYDANVVIELAGKRRHIDIRFEFFEKSYGHYYLTGSKELRFTDFGFTPPTKAMGLIKVEDELTINFNLVMSPL